MLKIETLERMNADEQQIIECQNIVFGMFTAPNKSINSQKDWNILENSIFQQMPKKTTNPQQVWFNTRNSKPVDPLNLIHFPYQCLEVFFSTLTKITNVYTSQNNFFNLCSCNFLCLRNSFRDRRVSALRKLVLHAYKVI